MSVVINFGELLIKASEILNEKQEAGVNFYSEINDSLWKVSADSDFFSISKEKKKNCSTSKGFIEKFRRRENIYMHEWDSENDFISPSNEGTARFTNPSICAHSRINYFGNFN